MKKIFVVILIFSAQTGMAQTKSEFRETLLKAKIQTLKDENRAIGSVEIAKVLCEASSLHSKVNCDELGMTVQSRNLFGASLETCAKFFNRTKSLECFEAAVSLIQDPSIHEKVRGLEDEHFKKFSKSLHPQTGYELAFEEMDKQLRKGTGINKLTKLAKELEQNQAVISSVELAKALCDASEFRSTYEKLDCASAIEKARTLSPIATAIAICSADWFLRQDREIGLSKLSCYSGAQKLLRSQELNAEFSNRAGKGFELDTVGKIEEVYSKTFQEIKGRGQPAPGGSHIHNGFRVEEPEILR